MSNVQGQPLPGQPLPADEREGAELRVHAVGSIGQVPAAEWDACANPACRSCARTPLKLKE